MSNICNNTIRVRGSKNSIIDFINFGLSKLGTDKVDALGLIEPYVCKWGMNKSNPNYPNFKEATDGDSSVNRDDKEHKQTYFGFECYTPMPSTYYYVDTTNSFHSKYEEGTKEYEFELMIYESEKKKQSELYGAIGWYNYRVKYFGDKWNCELVFMDLNEENKYMWELTLYAESAYSPVIEWVKNVQLQFPQLRFQLESEEFGNDIYDEYTADGFYDNTPRKWKKVDVEDINFEYEDRSGEIEKDEDEDW